MIKHRHPQPERSPENRACDRLLHALKRHAGPFSLLTTNSRRWASATFVGARHQFAIALQDEDVAARALRLRTLLGDLDLDFAGGFVADIRVTPRPDNDVGVLGIEALTIEEVDPPSLPVDDGKAR
jgi:hypothetical protein